VPEDRFWKPGSFHRDALKRCLHVADVLDRHGGIDPVLVEPIDVIGSESSEHAFRRDLDALGAAVQARATLSRIRINVPPGLPRDDDLVSDRSQSLTHELVIREWPVSFRSVEERHAVLGGEANDPGTLPPIRYRAVTVVQTHAAVSCG
jgi:hypothetical protein